MTKTSYWYEFFHMVCALCGLDDWEKRRVYDRPKPKAWHERHHIEDDACMSHFM